VLLPPTDASLLADLLDPAGADISAGITLHPKQQLASKMAARVDELLYGGAAGGGKTEWLLEYLADYCQRHAGVRCLILRRVFPSLNSSIVPRAQARLVKIARYNGSDNTFSFPNGSVLELGSMQYEQDKLKYGGVEYAVIAFEELTEFLEAQYTFMLTRLRTTIPGVKPHMIATTNPGNVGHRWVKKRFIRPEADKLRVGDPYPQPGRPFIMEANPDDPMPTWRVFIPAKLDDNPTILAADPGYVGRLNQISDPGLRKALREGDWDAIDQIQGALWNLGALGRFRVPAWWVDKRVGINRRQIALDPSDGDLGGDAFGVSDCALGMDGKGYVLGSWSWRGDPTQMAARAIALYYEVGASALVVERNHGGKWVPAVLRQLDPTVNIKMVWASQGKRTRAEPVAALFSPIDERPEDDDQQKLRAVRAHLAGFFPGLEAELTETDFSAGADSPNELDAMVWNLTDLCLGAGVARQTHRADNRLAGTR
jgi:hypothetical protein